jgi:hypothetical protein
MHSSRCDTRNTERRVSARRVPQMQSFRAERSAVAESTPTTVPSSRAEPSAKAVIPRGAKRSRGIHPDHSPVIPHRARFSAPCHGANG